MHGGNSYALLPLVLGVHLILKLQKKWLIISEQFTMRYIIQYRRVLTLSVT